jgi:predicted Zn-dependent protease
MELLVLAVVLFVVFITHPLISQVALSPNATSSISISPLFKKQSAKDDLNAIGTRNIGGGAAGDWYSLESEIRMGREYAGIVDSQVKLLDDPIVTEFINRLGQNLVRNSDAKVPFTI